MKYLLFFLLLPLNIAAQNDTLIPPPPPPPEPEIQYDDKLVLPLFPGCEHIEALSERKRCSERKMFQFIYEHLHFPSIEKEKELKGSVVIVQFIIEPDGTMTNIQLSRDIGGGMGAEVLRVVKLMQVDAGKWIPATQNGQAVKFTHYLPIRICLQ